MAEVDLGITKVNTEVTNSHFVTIHIVLIGASIITRSMAILSKHAWNCQTTHALINVGILIHVAHPIEPVSTCTCHPLKKSPNSRLCTRVLSNTHQLAFEYMQHITSNQPHNTHASLVCACTYTSCWQTHTLAFQYTRSTYQTSHKHYANTHSKSLQKSPCAIRAVTSRCTRRRMHMHEGDTRIRAAYMNIAHPTFPIR